MVEIQGHRDPISAPRTNPGRDETGKCKPCPPSPSAWQAARRLATYQINLTYPTTIHFTETSRNIYFAGKLIRTSGASVILDRLSSVRYRKQGSTTERLDHWPYGEEKPGATAQNREKFATYFRDATGWDYADQRYFNSQHGRFLTPDPHSASASVSSPQSWNRYPYVSGDPVNYNDPSGLYCVQTSTGEWKDDGQGPPELSCENTADIYEITVINPFGYEDDSWLPIMDCGGPCEMYLWGPKKYTYYPSNPDSGGGAGGAMVVSESVEPPVQVIAVSEIAPKVWDEIPPIAGSINVPVPRAPGLNVTVPFALLNDRACIGVGIALGGPGINVGPLVWGAVDQAAQVVSGFGWSGVGQLALGVQYIQSGSLSVGGPTVGNQGGSIAYSHSWCSK